VVPTSSASPWTNGAAETAVKTIKQNLRKWSQQEHLKDWSKELHLLTQAHNSSTSVYGFLPEELHFGFKNPRKTDLVHLWPEADSPDKYAQIVFEKAEKARSIARQRSARRNAQVNALKNKTRATKHFKLGELVLHRQLQVSTGSGGALKPKFTGPYVIQSIDKDDSSATLLHLYTNREIRAHYTNLQPFAFNPAVNRLPDSFDEEIWKLFPDKYSVLKYHPQTLIRRKLLNKQAALHRLNHQSSQQSTQNERPIADIRVQFNHRETPHIDHQTTVDRPATPFLPIGSSKHPTRERSVSPYQSRSSSNSLSSDEEPEDNLTNSSSSDGSSDNESLYSKAVSSLNEELGIPNSGSEYDSEVSHPRTANRPAHRSHHSTPDRDITSRLRADQSFDRDYVVDSDNSDSSGCLNCEWHSRL